jgi:hypothetical protein
MHAILKGFISIGLVIILCHCVNVLKMSRTMSLGSYTIGFIFGVNINGHLL